MSSRTNCVLSSSNRIQNPVCPEDDPNKRVERSTTVEKLIVYKFRFVFGKR